MFNVCLAEARLFPARIFSFLFSLFLLAFFLYFSIFYFFYYFFSISSALMSKINLYVTIIPFYSRESPLLLILALGHHPTGSALYFALQRRMGLVETGEGDRRGKTNSDWGLSQVSKNEQLLKVRKLRARTGWICQEECSRAKAGPTKLRLLGLQTERHI